MKTPIFYLLPFTALLSFTAQAQSRPAQTGGPAEQVVRQLTRLQAASRGMSAAVVGHPATTQRLPGQTFESNWATTGGWENHLKYDNLYNAQGKPSRIVVTDSITGDTLSRILYRYDVTTPGNEPTQVLIQNWFSSSWTDVQRNLFTYDTQLLLTEERTETFDGTAWKIKASTRYQNSYNAANQLVAQAVERYDSTARRFVNQVRYQYQVQPGGTWTQSTTQTWRDGAWADSLRLTSVRWHDFAKKQLLSALQQAPDARGQWARKARLSGTYTPTLNTLLTEAWDGIRYFNSQREVSRFDARGNNVEEAFEFWDDQTGTWEVMVGIRNQLTYDAAGDIATRTMQVALPFGFGYQNFLLYTYADYQTLALASRPRLLPAGTLQAYPNPSPDGHFQLQASLPAGPVALRVTDALGREVQRHDYPRGLSGAPTLDLSQQPTGLYTLELRTASGIARQKLTIQ